MLKRFGRLSSGRLRLWGRESEIHDTARVLALTLLVPAAALAVGAVGLLKRRRKA